MSYSNYHLLTLSALICIVRTSFSQENDISSLSQISEGHIKGPFTDHFMQWLQKNEYDEYDFAYAHLGPQASFGGKFSDNEEINHYPVIFIHGNSDGALSANYDEVNPSDEGWSTSIAEFLQNGYTSGEMYAITYGDRQMKNSVHRTMDCETVMRLRRFVEAVLAYTNSSYVDIISHSMGVSLARRLIKGGNLINPSERSITKVNTVGEEDGDFNECYVGESIHHNVHTFIGIAGANYGICYCSGEERARTTPSCGKTNGFWPGLCSTPSDLLRECLSAEIDITLKCGSDHSYSSFLENLNKDPIKEAKFVVSMWSSGDEIIGKSNLVWGRITSLIPQSDKYMVYNNLSHFEVKSKTAKDQYLIISASHSGQ